MLPFTYVVMVMNTRWQMGSDKQESFSFFLNQYLSRCGKICSPIAHICKSQLFVVHRKTTYHFCTFILQNMEFRA